MKIQPLRPNMLFTDNMGQLTKDAYDFLFTVFQRVGGSVDSPVIDNLSVITGVSDSSGLQHTRISTGSIAAGATAVITCTWGAPFNDVNYTVSATLRGTDLSVVSIDNLTTTSVKVTVANNNAGAPNTGIIHLIGMHD